MLDFLETGRPPKAQFIEWVNELWIFLHYGTTTKGRRARAYVLDAMRTL